MHESFERAAKAIRDSDKEPNLQKVTKEEKIKLYALYKQATEGDCENPDIKNVEPEEKERCEAWCKMKGRSKDTAEKEYVDLSKNLLNKYGASKLIDFWRSDLYWRNGNSMI